MYIVLLEEGNNQLGRNLKSIELEETWSPTLRNMGKKRGMFVCEETKKFDSGILW